MSSILPSNLDDLKKNKEELLIQEQLLLKKSFESSDPDQIIKANQYFKDVMSKNDTASKSYILDPWSLSNQANGYKDKPTSLSYNTLRNMGRTPIINSIITTRVEQVSCFSKPCFDEKGTGFIIRKKRSLFSKDIKNTKEDEKKIEYITNFILNCGNENMSWHGDSFDTFLRKITRDSLELDQATFEVIRNRRGLPIEFLATDASTFRIAETYDDNEYKQKQKFAINGYLPSYVQVFQNNVQAEFYPWELCFAIRNHYTDVRFNGYGVSELENMINIVTWSLYSDAYNGKFFSQGSAPKGILKVAGGINESRLHEFRQQWQSMVAGVQNAWRTPVLEADKMEWIDLQKGNRDMEFTKWQEYLIKLSCASYKIDPSEIGFPMSGNSDSKPMFEGNNEARLKYSKDKGLAPLLDMHQAKINKYIVNALDNQFEFVFVGLNPENEEQQVDLDIKKLGNFMTLPEIRKKYNLPDLKENDIILNSAYLQFLGMQEQKKQVQQQQQEQQNLNNSENNENYNSEETEKQYNDFVNSQSEENPIEKAFNNFLETLNNE